MIIGILLKHLKFRQDAMKVKLSRKWPQTSYEADYPIFIKKRKRKTTHKQKKKTPQSQTPENKKTPTQQPNKPPTTTKNNHQKTPQIKHILSLEK